MSGASSTPSEPLTMLVYKDGRVSHLPGPNPGTPYTCCGLDAGDMARWNHPTYAAAVWCTDCLQISEGMRDE